MPNRTPARSRVLSHAERVELTKDIAESRPSEVWRQIIELSQLDMSAAFEMADSDWGH